MSEPEFDATETIETEPQFVSPGALAQITTGEVSQMVATAKQWPRNLANVRKRAYHLITNNEQTATDCSYAIPRDGKVITGPSVRFAEIVFSAYTNCRVKSYVVDEGQEFITAEGMFFDVEANTAVSCQVKMRIVDKNGRRYSPDMIVNTANAAGSKASRNAILRGIPKAWWQFLYDEAQRVVKGDVKTLTERRDRAIDLFKPFGMTSAMLLQVLGVDGISDVTQDHLVTLQAVLNALKEKETSVEELMRNTQDRDVAEKGARTVDQIKVKYQRQAAAAQKKLDDKRKQAQKNEPTKAAEVIEEQKKEEQPEPF